MLCRGLTQWESERKIGHLWKTLSLAFRVQKYIRAEGTISFSALPAHKQKSLQVSKALGFITKKHAVLLLFWQAAGSIL